MSWLKCMHFQNKHANKCHFSQLTTSEKISFPDTLDGYVL